MQDIRLNNHTIGSDSPPFVIAEMSGNHEQDLGKAEAIIDTAAACGVDAIKLQTYTADSMTLKVREGNFFIHEQSNVWSGQSLHELYQQASTPWEWHRHLFTRARDRGLLAFSTPFSIEAVDLLEELEAPCYKIASFENSDLPLIRRVAATGKPLIMSTGMATLPELTEAVTCAREAGCNDLILLRCTSAYPAKPVDAHLRTLPHLRDLFNCQVGLSDHTPGTPVSIAAVALGATVIEKHFTLSRLDGGVDAVFSMEPSEMSTLVTETKQAWQALGKIHYGPTAAEVESRRYRRSLYIAKDLKRGEVLSPENLVCVRPAGGLAPRYFDVVMGRMVRRDVKMGTPVSWDLI